MSEDMVDMIAVLLAGVVVVTLLALAVATITLPGWLR